MSKPRKRLTVWLTQTQIVKLAKHETITVFRKDTEMVLGSKELSRRQRLEEKKKEEIARLEKRLKTLKRGAHVCTDCPEGSRTWPSLRSLGQHKRLVHSGAERYARCKEHLARVRAKKNGAGASQVPAMV